MAASPAHVPRQFVRLCIQFVLAVGNMGMEARVSDFEPFLLFSQRDGHVLQLAFASRHLPFSGRTLRLNIRANRLFEP